VFLALQTMQLAWSQAVSGSISGSVTDKTGAAIGSARLTLVNTANGEQRAVLTNEAGQFSISSVDPGQYSITVQAPGFKTLVRSGVVLSPSDILSVGDLVLDVGAVEERVTVIAQGATVQTASGERSEAVTSSQTEELPVYGRVVTSLVAIEPGVVDPIGAASRTLSGGSTTYFNVLGNRIYMNNFSMDGVTLTATGGAPNGTFGVSMEAVSEMKVLLSNYQPEYGRLSGSNVEIVTKSGTREVHGMGMYYMRNEDLNANNFFNNRIGSPRPVNRFNAFTYNVGGPMFFPKATRDKVFFFWNHEILPAKTTGALQYTTMPTALERQGNFSQSLSGGKLIPITDPSTGQPFPGNMVPQNRIDPNGLALLSVFPLPNITNTAITKGVYNYQTQFVSTSPTQLDLLKIDYNLRSSDVLSFTWNGVWQDTTTGPNGGGLTVPFPITTTVGGNIQGMAAMNYRHVFSPTMVDELTLGYAYTDGPISFVGGSLKNLQGSTYGFNAGQLSPSNNPLNLLPGMSFGGVSDAPGITYDGRFPFYGTRYVTDVGDNLSKTLGAHTLKAGIFYERMRQYDGPWAANFSGLFDFGTNANNPLNTGYAYSNALLGVFNSYTEASTRPLSLIYSTGLDTFVQDNWRISRKLTLDYGIRISWYGQFHNYNNEMAGFVPSFYDPKQAVQLIRPAIVNGARFGISPVTGQTYPSALIGFIAPGSGNPTNGMVVAAQTPGYPRALVDDFGPLAAPRFGFAYDPFGDGKTAIRGGFGVFYDRPLGIDYTANYSYPLVQNPLVYFGTLSTFRAAQGFISPPSVIGYDRYMKAERVMNMSLMVQRNIGYGTVVNLGYVGSLGRHLSWQTGLDNVPLGAQFNPANADPTNPAVPLLNAFLVPIIGYNSIGYNADAASSNYHSLQVTATRRFARGVQFGFAWTWSKAMDWDDTAFAAVNNAVPANLFRAWNYGLAGFDRTNVVKLNWQWDIPKWNAGFTPARAVANGWHLLGIYTYSSGAPMQVGFTQLTATNITGSPSVSARIQVNGNPNQGAGAFGPLQAFNPTVFSLPAVGTLGDPSKSLIRGPGLNNWDVSIFKDFPIRERLRMQLRAELYNALNHVQFIAVSTMAQFNAAGAQVNTQFEQYTAAQNPRIIQLAARLQF
jgi:hypothetical protein